jgi:hypothetical protein
MTSAAFKTPGNSEPRNVRFQWVQDNWELWKKRSSDWENTFWTVIQLRIPSRELGPLSRAQTWRSLTSWFCLVFAKSQLSWKHHKSRESQTLMTMFHDKICPQEGPPSHLPVQVSTAERWVQKCIVCCCINDVICQGDMYTVVNKVILSVYCVVSC